jgi:hypothetical protein
MTEALIVANAVVVSRLRTWAMLLVADAPVPLNSASRGDPELY